MHFLKNVLRFGSSENSMIDYFENGTFDMGPEVDTIEAVCHSA